MFRSKNPGIKDWPKKTFALSDFADDGNIGLHLTPKSRVVDADLDSHEARILAPHFLPDTTMKYGRPSKPSSHWMYQVDDASKIKHKKFTGLPDGDETPTLLERRHGTGKQTVIPPGVHESGEVIEYVAGCRMAPTEVSAKTLSVAFDKLAVALLVASMWKPGVMNELAMAVAAFSLKSGADVNIVTEIMSAADRSCIGSTRIVVAGEGAGRSGCLSGSSSLAHARRPGERCSGPFQAQHDTRQSIES